MPPLNKKTASILLLITAVGFFLRFYRLEQQSFWTDEVSSVNTARAPWSQITEMSASLNNSLPVYFAILRPFVGTTNEHIEFRARVLSALAGGLTVPLFMWLLYSWRESLRVAVVGGSMLAVNPLHLWYSQEVRAYALMLLSGVLAMVLYELSKRTEKNRLGWTIGYILSAILTAALHKTGMAFFVTVAAWELWKLFRSRTSDNAARPLPWLSMWPHVLAGVFIFSLFALKSFPPTKEYGRPGSVLELGYTGMTYLGGYSFGPSLTEIQNFGPLNAIKRHPIQVTILVTTVLVLGILIIRKWRRVVLSKELLLLLFGVGLVVFASLVSSFPYNVRYTLPGLIGFLALLALVNGEAPQKWRCLMLAAILSVEIYSVCQWFRLPLYRKGDSRAIARWLLGEQGRVKTWTVLPDYLEASILFYLPSNSVASSSMMAPTGPQNTTFPPVPDALILGRRHHLVEPDKVIDAYKKAVGGVGVLSSMAGFEVYTRNEGNPGGVP